MRFILLLALLTSISFAGGREEGKPSSLALAKIVSKMSQDGVDTLKFNNERIIVIIRKVNLDSAAVENYARGLDKDSVKNDSDALNLLQVKGYCPKDVSAPVNYGNDTSVTSIESLRVKGYQEW